VKFDSTSAWIWLIVFSFIVKKLTGRDPTSAPSITASSGRVEVGKPVPTTDPFSLPDARKCSRLIHLNFQGQVTSLGGKPVTSFFIIGATGRARNAAGLDAASKLINLFESLRSCREHALQSPESAIIFIFKINNATSL